MVKYTSRPLYSRGKGSRCPVEKRPSGPNGKSRSFSEENNHSSSLESNWSSSGATRNELSRLLIHSLKYIYIYCHVLGACEYRRDMDWILDLLTQFGTTCNYRSTADFHTLQFTTAPAKLFPTCYVLTCRFLVTDVNSGDSSASRAQFLFSQDPCVYRTLVQRTHYRKDGCLCSIKANRTLDKEILSKWPFNGPPRAPENQWQLVLRSGRPSEC
jgi:hypothetical protein